jgi:hypothetical protein
MMFSGVAHNITFPAHMSEPKRLKRSCFGATTAKLHSYSLSTVGTVGMW